MRHFQLSLETGAAPSETGDAVVWAACPDLPGAYVESSSVDEAVAALRALTVEILAEHLLRDDALDPAVIELAAAALPGPGILAVTVTPADIAAARDAPLLDIEAPEP